MKTLFIYPQILEHEDIPIALTILSAVLRKAGHSVAVFDCSQYAPAEDLITNKQKLGMFKPTPPPPVSPPPPRDIQCIEKDIVNTVIEFSPDLIGITATSGTYSLGLKLSKVIKKKFPDARIIFGGTHPTICPEEVIQEDSVDIVCIGEGEDALEELCAALEEKRPIHEIKNLWVKNQQNHELIHRNPFRKLKDLNFLPVQDFTDFHEYEFYRPLDGKIYKMMNTDVSRGCIFKCSYCVNHVLQELFKGCGTYHRRKTPEVTVRHLKELRDAYQFEMIRFWDEDFTSFPMSYLKEFSRLYQKEVNLPFLIYAGTRTITEEKVACLRDMNCVTIAMGIESGNAWMRKYILNRDISDDEIIEKFEIVKKSGIRCSAYNMIGLPFETRGMVFDTIHLNRKVNASTSSVAPFKPYPRTRLAEIAKEFGFLKKTPDYTNWQTDMDSPYLGSDEIDGLVRTFSLYVKLPEEFFPILEKSEKSKQFSQEVFPKLIRFLDT